MRLVAGRVHQPPPPVAPDESAVHSTLAPSLAPVALLRMSLTLTSWLVLTKMLYRKLSSIHGARSPTCSSSSSKERRANEGRDTQAGNSVTLHAAPSPSMATDCFQFSQPMHKQSPAVDAPTGCGLPPLHLVWLAPPLRDRAMSLTALWCSERPCDAKHCPAPVPHPAEPLLHHICSQFCKDSILMSNLFPGVPSGCAMGLQGDVSSTARVGKHSRSLASHG
jgi:hypothetical protein